MNKKRVIVIIPIYTTRLTDYEQASLRQCFKVLASHEICFVKPQSLDPSPLAETYRPNLIVDFPDSCFLGIAAYNRLMMSPRFYETFESWDYMLIYQPDAWVFDDQLDAWCARGYDYIGAPWIPKPKYGRLYYRIFNRLKRIYCHISGASDYSQLYYRVGNGGLSLRHIDTFARTARDMEPQIARYLSHPGIDFYNEDIFWSLEVNRHEERLKIPHWQEALQFSFDKNPAACYELNGHRLPFGCHGWSKKNMLSFWEQHIQTLRHGN
ncbi:DUF5672 family protein [Barnesiella sp. An55]|uniref:DUF5672 family protein n=1 Tax=Barnesiella sp. An55 TaxID=1965646 RepID=UPI000B39F56F|nr:DUF5672 family protein [Barnesiella sp. An55]OUN73897.1 hypothetical protein B5G10_02390 [Barnesiella sp. An55]HIZ26973.1 hypothetical protein [Candidatus Barnesiella merdipullorum]